MIQNHDHTITTRFLISLTILKIKIKINKWSEERQHHSKMKIKHIQQGIGGIKA